MQSRKTSNIKSSYNDFSTPNKRKSSQRFEPSDETKKAIEELKRIDTIQEFQAACERAAKRNNRPIRRS